MLDIIGDIHGHAERAEALLRKLGYRMNNGAYRHPDRQALFLGDLVDRGPQQVETIMLVRRMVEAGSGLAILGNHEYNAVAYVTPNPLKPGRFLRENSKRNRHQHEAFLDQVGEGSELHREIIAWFKTLPVAFENDGLRAIHACWHHEYFEQILPYLNDDWSLTDEAWVLASQKNTPLYVAFETLLKGMEIELPEGLSYTDKDGIERKKTRTRWWDENAVTYNDLGIVPRALRDQLPADKVQPEALCRYRNDIPVLIGHYWMSGTPEILNKKAACLDYSIGKGTASSKLCAYRWDGEQTLDNSKLVWVDGPSVKPIAKPESSFGVGR
jgi:hypothetical protein